MTPTCLAKPSNLESKFNNNEYDIQLHNLITEVNKINNDVKNGKISQEKANETVSFLIDDPRYNQVKLKKQIVEREYETAINETPPMIPKTHNDP